MTSWPGKLVNISVGIFDETNQSASEFLQLEPANNIEVSNNPLTSNTYIIMISVCLHIIVAND